MTEEINKKYNEICINLDILFDDFDNGDKDIYNTVLLAMNETRELERLITEGNTDSEIVCLYYATIKTLGEMFNEKAERIDNSVNNKITEAIKQHKNDTMDWNKED